MKFEWETLIQEDDDSQNMVTCRSKVFGGWLVRQNWWIKSKNWGNSQEHESICCALSFVADPKHEWSVK